MKIFDLPRTEEEAVVFLQEKSILTVSINNLRCFCFKYWSFSNKVFLKIKSLKKKKKKKITNLTFFLHRSSRYYVRTLIFCQCLNAFIFLRPRRPPVQSREHHGPGHGFRAHLQLHHQLRVPHPPRVHLHWVPHLRRRDRRSSRGHDTLKGGYRGMY